MKKKKKKTDNEEEKKEDFFHEVAEKTSYAPVSFEADIKEAEKNELVLKAEEKLFLHNIEVADKMNQAFLDIDLSEIPETEEGKKQESDEKKDIEEEA